MLTPLYAWMPESYELRAAMKQTRQIANQSASAETEPLEIVVHDQEERCSYLAGRTARMPLRMPITKLTGEQFDQRLAAGDRRSGAFLYRTNCPQCKACEPIRIQVDQFQPNRSQKRAWRKGERELTTILGPPIVDQLRIDMFNEHRWQRGLAGEDREIDEHGYESFLVETCCDTFEIRYYLDSQLIAVAICDEGNASVSAVYCFFDPAFSRYSLGTYSVLKLIELCQLWGKCYLYLGLYIAESPNMSYKANFRPHQRLIGGSWQNFDR